ncbi:hypothetical protein C2869_15640 [Saccharobesus litoralis]|uniref:Uncharacterized protein n=1 Tax=Saccharobesus litoralis TaxID=2172099 RepID=A0A2S0VUJ4_9ALTE|nr:hypothetical protein [Saccharobesus litoralis]AWB67770.1 hypothetical protein C2869_15640 [Saccharobesus litoralis]
MSQKFLLLYNIFSTPNAQTISDHIRSFAKYSKFEICSENMFDSNGERIANLSNYTGIIFHYSLFGSYPFKLPPSIIKALSQYSCKLKIAFFQDEYQYCQQRFQIIKDLGINCIFSCFEPNNFGKIYGNNTNVEHIYPTLTGYVDEKLISVAKSHYSHIEKDIDVSYRARELKYFMGKGAREKFLIGEQFKSSPYTDGLIMDISSREKDRLYGEDWLKLLARSKATLGVESGVSIVDLFGEVKPLIDEVLAMTPNASFDLVHDKVLHKFENNIYYRAISPRLFECTVFKTLLILFEGHYQGIIEPDKHYIPLKKDFSNIKEVVDKLSDQHFTKQIVENAYNELINSQKYSYKNFIKQFDDIVKELLNGK